jgi:hypothetical protein
MAETTPVLVVTGALVPEPERRSCAVSVTADTECLLGRTRERLAVLEREIPSGAGYPCNVTDESRLRKLTFSG